MRKKIIGIGLAIFLVGLIGFGIYMIQEHGKIIPFIGQLSRDQVADNV